MLNQLDINTAYFELSRTKEAYGVAAELEITTKATLDKAVLVALSRGQIDGKNEQARTAQAREILPEQFEAFETAAQEARRTKLLLDLALVEVERIRALLRLDELTAVAEQSRKVNRPLFTLPQMAESLL